jgi:hypothetical protein
MDSILANAGMIWRVSVSLAAASFLAMSGAGGCLLYRRRDFDYRGLLTVLVLSVAGGGVTRVGRPCGALLNRPRGSERRRRSTLCLPWGWR